MRIISFVIYNFSPLPSVIFSADGAENDYLYLRGAVFFADLYLRGAVFFAACGGKKHSPIYNRLLIFF